MSLTDLIPTPATIILDGVTLNPYSTSTPVPVTIISGGGGGSGTSGTTDSTGALFADTEGQKSSYVISGFFTPQNSATDVLTLSGSASKTVRVKRVHVTSLAGTFGAYSLPLQLLLRSSADGGGTSTALTPTKFDSNNPSATSVAAQYTANPTSLGTLIGVLDSCVLDVGVVGSAPPYDRSFGTANEQSIVLRGASQFLCLNFGEQASSAGSGQIAYTVVWSEE